MTHHHQLSLVAALAAPGLAMACSCVEESDGLEQQLKSQFADSTFVYVAQVSTTDGKPIGGVSKLEVLEVFKGPLPKGSTLDVRTGGGGDCTVGMRAGDCWLIYATTSPGSVSVCSRSRTLSLDDAELAWLRTKRLPPIPVAVQRASVDCTPCSVDAELKRLAGTPYSTDDGLPWLTGQPFRTNVRYFREDRTWRGIGQESDGGSFQVIDRRPQHSPETCRTRVSWQACARLTATIESIGRGGTFHPEPLTSKSLYALRSQNETTRTEFACVDPGKEHLACDESETRTETWGPLEPLSVAACEWRDPTAPNCRLNPSWQSPDAGIVLGPVLRCVPSDVDDPAWFSCRVESSTDAGRPRRAP